MGVEPPEPDGRSGDLPSVGRTASELRRAGFRDVVADGSWLAHAFTVEGYVAFMVEFDEASLFEELEAAFRERLLGRLRDRLARLSPDELTMRFPIVYGWGGGARADVGTGRPDCASGPSLGARVAGELSGTF